MIYLLLNYLRSEWHLKIPSAFFYFSTRMMLSAITSLLLTLWLGPWFIRILYRLKMGQPIRGKEECPLLAELHSKKKETPTMGGILILSSMLLSLLLWMDLTNVFTLILALTTIFLGILGAIDDYWKLKKKNSRGVSAKTKLFCQTLLASLIALYLLSPAVQQLVAGKEYFHPPVAKEEQVSLTTQEYSKRFYLPFQKEPWILEGALGNAALFCLVLFVITGASNAVNLTDGLDGLASGCLIMVSLVLALFAFFSNHLGLARYLHILYIDGSGEIAIYLFALTGATLGFLWYNSYPAQIFMGDTGSLALGGILGVAAILLRRECILAIAGIIFVAEALSVILQVLSYRYRHKKRIFLCAPLHHHFEYKGWHEVKVVVRFWIISLLFAIIAVASLKFQ
ncbi:MAG: phospho-N-acetylmuramoyl-pentapeptide-transferase [Verrucomicrobiota bacterium]|nr:phospho-N-acetylmuramoyl-pentapeptide-transferase [Verrucomicrobiota bacterium]